MTGIPTIKNPLALKVLWVVLFAILTGCEQSDHNWIPPTEGTSILDMPYENDSLGLHLHDIRLRPDNDSVYQVRAYMQAQNPEAFVDDHSFYFHFYQEPGMERDGNFLSVRGVKDTVLNNIIIYRGVLRTSLSQFKMLRYGLADGRQKRLFSLVVDTSKIKLK